MTHLRAKVPPAGSTADDSMDLSNDLDIADTESLIPKWVEIEPSNSGYWLAHIFQDGLPFIHTWHSTVGEAKAEARADFNIREDDWLEVPTKALKK